MSSPLYQKFMQFDPYSFVIEIYVLINLIGFSLNAAYRFYRIFYCHDTTEAAETIWAGLISLCAWYFFYVTKAGFEAGDVLAPRVLIVYICCIGLLNIYDPPSQVHQDSTVDASAVILILLAGLGYCAFKVHEDFKERSTYRIISS